MEGKWMSTKFIHWLLNCLNWWLWLHMIGDVHFIHIYKTLNSTVCMNSMWFYLATVKWVLYIYFMPVARLHCESWCSLCSRSYRLYAKYLHMVLDDSPTAQLLMTEAVCCCACRLMLLWKFTYQTDICQLVNGDLKTSMLTPPSK